MPHTLSSDIWAHIFTYATLSDRVQLRAICRTWREILDIRQQCWADMPRETIISRFQAGASKGQEKSLRWLAKRFGLTADDVRASDNYALRYSCAKGHLEVAKWLVATFDLTAADASANSNYALRYSCANGHLSVVKWLVGTFSLMVGDASANINYTLLVSCANGHLGVAQWLAATFSHDARAEANYALRWACAKGHLEVAKWLAEAFSATKTDIQTSGVLALARTYKHQAVVHWLENQFGIK